MGVRDRLRDWLNAGFDPAATDPVLLKQVRGVTAGLSALLLLTPLFVAYYLWLALPWLAATVAASAGVSTASLVTMRRRGDARRSAHVALLALSAIAVTISVAGGGFHDPSFSGLYVVPLAAFAWLGRRDGIGWTMGTVLVAIGMWALHQAGTQLPTLIGEHELARHHLLMRLGTLFALASLAAAWGESQRQTEDDLTAQRDEARSKVAQSRRAEHAAERDARAQATLVATVSHELRTPMNAALGSAALLMETELSREQREYVQTIHHSGQALLDVVNDILDFSRIEADALRLDRREFSLRHTLETVGEMLAPLAHAKQLELVTDIHPDLPERVVGDGPRLRQIVLNLLSNALKFTEHGEIVLRARRGKAGRVILRVEDSGVGMSPAQTQQIFEAFRQAEPSTCARYGGTGLGLTIARKLSQLMDGDVHVWSSPGKGTVFQVDIALEEASCSTSIRPPISPQRVLVVDDHPEVRQQLAELLTEWGMTYTGVGEATAATHLLRVEGSFAAVLVDAHLPDDGACRVLSAARHTQTRSILMRAPGHPRDLATNAGAHDGFVRKPLRRDALLQALTTPADEASSTAAPDERSPTEQDAPLVLVADDNPTGANLAKQMIRRHGYRCEVVPNGDAVLERVRQGDVSAVLMDCQMPGVDGFEATRRLRLQPEHAQLPIIALTAHALDSDRRRVLDAGMDDFVTKPYTQHSLLQALARWCPLLADDTAREESGVMVRGKREIRNAYDSALRALRDYVPPEQPQPETAQLLESFLDKASARLTGLRDALETEDTDTMLREAHALRGSLGFLGLLSACDCCTHLGTLSLPEGRQQAAQDIEHIERALAAIACARPPEQAHGMKIRTGAPAN